MNSLSIANLEKLLYHQYNLHASNHFQEITVLKISSDNRYLFSGSEDKTITQFSLKKSKSKYIFSGHKSGITSLEEYESILYSSDKQSIIIWDLKTRLKLSLLQVSGYLTNLTLIPSLQFLFASNKDGSISVFQTPKGTRANFEPFKIESIGSPINSLTVKSSDNASNFLLISGHNSGKVVIRTLDSETLKILDNHKRRVNCLCSNTELLVSGSDDKCLNVWSLHDFQFLSRLEGHSWAVTACLLPPDGSSIVSASNDNSLIVWKKFVKVYVFKSDSWAFNSIVCSEDGSLVYSAGDDSIIRIWDFNQKLLRCELTGHTKEISCFHFDPEARFCVTGSKDKTVRVWKLHKSQQKWVFKGFEDMITVVKISNDCKWVVSGSMDTTIRVWNMKNGKNVSVLSEHFSSIQSLALSPDNKYFVSSGRKVRNVVLWSYKSKKHLRSLDEYAISMCFTPFKRFLVIDSGYIWTVWKLPSTKIG